MTGKKTDAALAFDSFGASPFKQSRERQFSRKVNQLCKQVQRTLSMVFAGSDDEILNDLMVDSVIPAPDASHLLITVYYTGSEAVADARSIIDRLQEEKGAMKTEVAQVITRRKAPELSFRLI